MKEREEQLRLRAVYRKRLTETLPRVRDRMHGAAAAGGRDPSAVRLVAVTKGHPVEALEAAVTAGLHDLGENRIEEMEEKVARLGHGAATWHMIGHLQSRKVSRAIAVGDLIHSVDTLKLAERISRVAVDSDRDVRILAQVNTSGEESKSGFDTERAVEQIHRMVELPRLRLEGLMTMAPFVDDEKVVSSAFGRLRETADRARRIDPRVGQELSMGMTNDLEIAIREGSTMVRIGTALFGERG